MSTAAIDQFDELPRIKGPALSRFEKDIDARIKYLELLGRADDDEQSPDGDHGYVFRALIDGKLCAVKVFRFFDVEETRGLLDPRGRSRVSREDIEGQTDPFYAECRAYGKLATKPRKNPVAIACHGFISIPAKRESFFAKKFNITDWNRPEEEFSLPPDKRQPFRALVKDLVETDPEVTQKLIASMRRELRALNSMQIYVMDVRWANYKGGHLVDFSSAWTAPHFEFRRDVNSKRDIEISKRIDMAAFNKMVKEELGMELSPTLRPDPARIANLRPRRKRDYRS